MRLRILHITETDKSHMDPFQEISHICSTAYNTGLLSPYHPCPGLLYPSFKASLYRHVFFSPSLSFSSHRGGSTKAQLSIKGDDDGLCVILTCGSFLESHFNVSMSGTQYSSVGFNGASTGMAGKRVKQQEAWLGSSVAFSWPNPQWESINRSC